MDMGFGGKFASKYTYTYAPWQFRSSFCLRRYPIPCMHTGDNCHTCIAA